VLDESHSYRGAFGAHVSLIIRRLLRICLSYGNNTVQFICCSATLADPAKFFNQLVPKCVFHPSSRSDNN
jgi:DEAD/DEAH box helicase domain-containing protein